MHGDNNATKRKDLWKEMVSQAALSENIPWVVLGDLRCNARQEREKGGVTDWPPPYINDLHECNRWPKFEDLKCIRMYFTWFNKRPENHIWRRKLDGALVNQQQNPKWHFIWPTSYLQLYQITLPW